MEPIKTSQANCNPQNPGLYARTNRYYDIEDSNEDNEHNKYSEAYKHSILQHGTWPVKRDSWTGQQINYPDQQSSSTSYNEMASVVSYASEHGCSENRHDQRRLGAKVDVVYSLLGMLGSTDGREDMSATLQAMSNSIDSCLIMRQSGCLPLLIQLIHANGQNPETRERAARALHNVIHARGDEKIGRREARVLRLLEQIRDYCQMLRISLKSERPLDDLERHPGPTIAALMKLSFDEAHRHAMCQLGGLHAVTELIEMDHAAHGSDSDDQSCITLRRYAGMALTNLTFGDGNNKALLCSFREFMKALVSQLRSLSDDLRQVTASVLRNLSWRADSSSKQTLREVGAVTALMKAAMEGRKESTLKSILSALWNLSAHCSTNKVDICAVEGALAFLVDMLSYKAPSKTLSIVENAGGILRNVSSHIALREDYRAIVRERGCLQVLLRQLRSPSLTVVSNACGTLWNLSARCPHDQRLLWDLGAVPMLRSLVHSKHKMISMGSSAALKNLLNARPYGSSFVHLDSTARCLGLPTLPSLVVRRQRALEQEIDQNLSETCDNIEPSTSPTNKDDKFTFKIEPNYKELTLQRKTYQNHNNQVEVSPKINGVSRSESKESMRSVTSTHSDTIFERVNRYISNELTPSELQSKQQSSSLHSAVSFNAHAIPDVHNKMNQVEKKYALHYKNMTPEQLSLMEIDINDRNMKSITSTISWTIADDQKSTCSLLRSSIKDKLSPTGSTKSIIDKSFSDYETFAYKRISLNYSQSNYNNLSVKSLADTVDFNEPQKLIDEPRFLHASNHKSESDPYGDYAETDLDEPTNYSLRYAERNSDEDEKPRLEYLIESEQTMEDTVKTYYTEGTPHDTSLNSSRTASQSDLQYDKVKQLQGKTDVSKNKDIQYFLKANKSKIQINNVACIGKKVLECHKKLTQDSSSHSHQQLLNSSKLPQSFLEIQIDSPNIKKTDNIKSLTTIDTNVTNINLAINSEPKIINDSYSIEPKVIKKQNGMIELESLTESAASDGDDDDEDLLAACIHIGMKNNRHMQSFRRNIPDENLQNASNLNCYHIESTPDHTNSQISENVNSLFKLKQINLHRKISSDYNEETNQENQNDLTSTKQTCANKIMMNIVDNADRNSVDEKSSLERNSSQSTLLQTMSSESIESYDSVERSEQVLLELCIKSGSSKTDKILLKDYDSSETAHFSNNLSHEFSVPCEVQMAVNTNGESKNQEEEEEYRRQRDPDAMIASLDRLTATLVQQTEAMREKESITMKQSILSDLWNEDSPNDSSFPTISMSVPLIASFKSDIQEDTVVTFPSLNENTAIQQSNIKASEIIEAEALKVAEAMTSEFNIHNQTTQDLDDIKPPSLMNSILSLTTSFVGAENGDNLTNQDQRNSTSLPPTLLSRIIETHSRKKSLPISIVAKRTLVQGYVHTGSLENLLNDSSISNVSQLENVKPPSMMDEILDNGDMENSMLSVASIVSEITDSKNLNSRGSMGNDSDYDNVKPITHIPLKTHIKNMGNSATNSLSEYLENINPPSLFNEISEIDDTTMDANTETMCSDTLCIDYQLHTDEIHPFDHETIEKATTDNDTDEASTPISTEYSSSAESTPKKLLKKQHITPKQRRQLAKERYRTYTIAAKLIKKEGNECTNKEKFEAQIIRTKLTPKQRRQEDPLRFQTQILHPLPKALNGSDKIRESLIPSPKAVVISKTSYQQKPEKKILLHDDSHLQNNQIILNENASGSNMQTMLKQNANIVLYTLNESSKPNESLLDYETLSLVSNDSEAEKNLRIRIANLSEKKHNYSPRFDQQVTENQSGVNIRNKPESTEEVSEASGSENEIQFKEKSLKRPHIIKPKSREISSELLAGKLPSNSPKGIRGRRKALYSNPNNKKTSQATPETVNANITSGRSNISPVVRTTRVMVLKQNVNSVVNNDQLKLGVTQKIPSTVKNITLSKKSSIPQRKTRVTSKSVKNLSSSSDNGPSGNPSTPVPKPLERQNTFTKDEPEMENVPSVVLASPSTSKIAKPVRGLSAKVYPTKSKIAAKSHQPTSQESKLTKCASAERIASPRIPTTITSKRYSSTEIGSKTLLNNTNTNTQISKKSINLGQRSNSNSNIVTPNSQFAKKLTKETTSKVATVWKKVDENRNRRFQKCKSEQCDTVSTELSTENKTTSQSPTTRLFRSSTFNGITTEVDTADVDCQEACSQIKGLMHGTSRDNSCDLTGSSTADIPCKIPVRYSNSKINEKTIENRIVLLRKDHNTELSQTNQMKRISRLGSFISVDSPGNQSRTSHENIARSVTSDTIPIFNYTPRSKVALNATKSSIERSDMTGIITASTQVTTV